MKIETLRVSRAYPVLWLGETGWTIDKMGRLVVVQPSPYEPMDPNKRNETETLVWVVGRVEAGEIPFQSGHSYILAGGIHPPILAKVDAILWIHDDLDYERLQFLGLIRASGIGRWGYSAMAEPEEPIWDEEIGKEILKEEKGPILCCWPDKFRLVKGELIKII
jgi:hypothetical protein